MRSFVVRALFTGSGGGKLFRKPPLTRPQSTEHSPRTDERISMGHRFARRAQPHSEACLPMLARTLNEFRFG